MEKLPHFAEFHLSVCFCIKNKIFQIFFVVHDLKINTEQGFPYVSLTQATIDQVATILLLLLLSTQDSVFSF